ncbi:hypothetical protein [Bizionia arctica]|uniref:Uncharacterized protein n=1 Tax=Bizionia arctica TaxID=1495645 RepID=A0A917GDI1_9FLAO|nr:hypothetical protein [Bizionia arctica]GGG39750.1 hypothetical protein GCM10010976_09260 [Bizionia arctica]
MAEIKIEKKKPVWPWILGFIILLGLVAYFVYENNENEDYSDDVNSEEIYNKNTDTIYKNNTYQDTQASPDSNFKVALMDYSESISDSTRIGVDSTYTKTALYYLSNVVIATATQHDLESSKAWNDLEQYASQEVGMNTSDMPERSGISKNLKSVTNNIVTVLETLQTKNFPALQAEVANLKATSNKLTSSTIDKQKTTLQTFFRKANEVLIKMNS